MLIILKVIRITVHVVFGVVPALLWGLPAVLILMPVGALALLGIVGLVRATLWGPEGLKSGSRSKTTCILLAAGLILYAPIIVPSIVDVAHAPFSGFTLAVLLSAGPILISLYYVLSCVWLTRKSPIEAGDNGAEAA